MQEKPNIKKRHLISLYTSHYLNKISIIIFILTLVLLLIIFITSAEKATPDFYASIDELIHEWYFNNAFFALTIVVAIFSCFIGSLEVSSNISRVDAMLIGNVSRTNIFVYKLSSFLIINTLFYIIVFVMLFAVPLLSYERFQFKLEYLNILVDMILWGTFITIFSMLITMFLQNYFTGLLTFILFFITKIISDGSNQELKSIANIIFPQLLYDRYLNTSFLFDRIFVINIIVIIIIAMYLIYNKKSLKI